MVADKDIQFLKGDITKKGVIQLIKKLAVSITGGTMTGGLETPELIVGDAGTESSGINIGGVNFESSFKVSDIDGTNYAQTILHRHSTVLEPLIVGARSNSDTASHTDVTSGQNVFTVYGAGWAGSNYKLFASINLSVDSSGTISNSSAPGKVVINVTPDGSVTPIPALTITNDKKTSLSGDLSFSAGKGMLPNLITDATTARTLALTDAFSTILMTSASANTITIPLNATVAFKVGTRIDIIQTGAGKTSFVATGGVTLDSLNSVYGMAGQYSGASLIKVASDTWILVGAIVA